MPIGGYRNPWQYQRYMLPTNPGDVYSGPDLMGGDPPGAFPGSSLPPAADPGNDPGGFQPPSGFAPSGPYYPGVNPSGPAFSDPFQPGFTYTGPGSGGYTPSQGGATPPPYQPPSLEITGDTPSPGGGQPNNPFAGAVAGGTPGNYNYYDAGNGITYVYDSNWNYVGTVGNNTFAGATATGTPGSGPPVSGGNFNAGGFDPNAGFYGQPITGAGPYQGGNQNQNNPGYVAPGVGPQDNPQTSAPGSGFSTTLGGGYQVTARNI